MGASTIWVPPIGEWWYVPQMQITRRSSVTGLVGLVAAPTIVMASSLMPVKVTAEPSVITPLAGNSHLPEMKALLDECYRKLLDEIANPPWIVENGNPVRQMRPDPERLATIERLRSELASMQTNPD